MLLRTYLEGVGFSLRDPCSRNKCINLFIFIKSSKSDLTTSTRRIFNVHRSMHGSLCIQLIFLLVDTEALSTPWVARDFYRCLNIFLNCLLIHLLGGTSIPTQREGGLLLLEVTRTTSRGDFRLLMGERKSRCSTGSMLDSD